VAFSIPESLSKLRMEDILTEVTISAVLEVVFQLGVHHTNHPVHRVIVKCSEASKPPRRRNQSLSMVKRGPKTAVDQLQAALTRSLKESVADTVSSVCESFQQAVKEQAAAVTSASAQDPVDSDAYYNHCRRLVNYMQQNMETSPGFIEQMDRIILACHSGASQRVLNSVVTKQLWMRRHGDVAPPVARETRSSRKSSSSSGSGRGRTTTVKKEKKEVLRSSSSGRMATRASTESPAMHTRSASGSKRIATRGSSQDTQPVKRPRRAAARKVIQDSSDEGEEEEEEEKPVPVKTRKAKKPVQEEEDDDELLSFEDAIGELCYADRRTPSQTEFFKKRLRKSIQFVDALLCKPPPGKVCGRGCNKIRAQMCSSSTPCKNKMCRIWHDVEAHTDRCQNTQCEFKNRILLRETMHKLEMKEQQVAETKADLEGKQTTLTEAREDEKEALEEDIARVEHALEEFESELAVLEATKKTFWGNLNEIGIEVSDDVADNFPDFATHYEDKRAPRKARKTLAAEAMASSSRSSRAAARPEGAGPHGGDADEDAAEDADAESAGTRIPRRTARRSTSSARHSAHELDEETKGGDEETKGEDADVYEHDPSDIPRPDEPPLPPAGLPPPFRQNPEFDRDFTVSASGYSIHPPADDLEAPAVAASTEPPQQVAESSATENEPPQEATEPAVVSSNGLTDEQLADMQRSSEAISGLMADISPMQPPAELPVANAPQPADAPGFTIRGSQPQNP